VLPAPKSLKITAEDVEMRLRRLLKKGLLSGRPSLPGERAWMTGEDGTRPGAFCPSQHLRSRQAASYDFEHGRPIDTRSSDARSAGEVFAAPTLALVPWQLKQAASGPSEPESDRCARCAKAHLVDPSSARHFAISTGPRPVQVGDRKQAKSI
jgi:hypothetical protein